MNIIPKAGPNLAQSPLATSTTSSQEARERAIAKLTQNSNQGDLPVHNASQVSPEERSAIQAPRQTRTNEDVATPSPAEAPAKSTPEAPLSAQYANLARKERAIRSKVQEIQRREEALKAQEVARAAPPAPSFDPSKYVEKERLNKDTLNALLEAGLTYDQVTAAMLNQPDAAEAGRNQEMNSLKAEIQALRDEQKNTNKNIEDQNTNTYNQAIAQMLSDTKNLVRSDESFEAIRETRSEDDVVELIKKTFEKDGHLLSVEDAAREVEDYLVEEAVKISKLKKIQQRLQAQNAKSQPTQQQQSNKQQPQQMKTLTNAVGNVGKLSAKERAILAFKGELK